MGDIYQIYDLPPPPPPTFLSFYNGPDRARLPNFLDSSDPVGAAHQYLHDQIMFECIGSIWTQVKVVTGLAGLILVAALAVVCRRLFQRSLWFFRVKPTERGPMIVPNALMVFAGAEGIFAIIFLAFMNKIYVAWDIEKRPLDHLILWIVLTWTPLIAGPIWSSFGVWHARPASSGPRSRDTPTVCGIQIWLPHSIFISLFWLSVPFMVFFSVLPLGIKGNNYRQHGVDLYYDWLDRYSNATQLSRPMLIELQQIWAFDLRAFYWLALAMFVWFFWTVVLFVAYIYVSLRLLLPLRHQVAELRERNRRRAAASTSTETGAGPGLAGPGTISATYFDPPKSQVESVQLPLETPRLRSLAANFVGGRIETVDFEDGALDEHWGVNAKDLQAGDLHRSFFPPVKPSAVVSPAPDSETSEAYLSSAYRHFLFQAGTITLGIVFFSELTIYLALTIYSHNERRDLGRPIDTAFLQAMWGTVFFGIAVLGSITLRTYEPMLVNFLHNTQVLPKGSRQSLSAQTLSKNKLRSMLNRRQHDPGHATSFLTGEASASTSSSPLPPLSPVQPVNAAVQTQSHDSHSRNFRKNIIVRSTQGNVSPSFNVSRFPQRKLSASGRQPVLDFIPSEEEDAEGVLTGSPRTRTRMANNDHPTVDVQQPFLAYDAGLSFPESSTSLNDVSLRETPYMKSLQRYDSSCSYGEDAGSANEPALIQSQPHSPTYQERSHEEGRLPTSPSTSSSLEQKMREDMGHQRQKSSTATSSDEERTKAGQTGFVPDELNEPGGTRLPPAPRQSRRPAEKSQSS